MIRPDTQDAVENARLLGIRPDDLLHEVFYLEFDRPVRLTGAPADFRMLQFDGNEVSGEAITLSSESPTVVRIESLSLAPAAIATVLFIPEHSRAIAPLRGGRVLAAFARCDPV